MLAFRSEAHVSRWCDRRGAERGAVFSLDRLWGLARAWYADKLSPEWRRPGPAAAQQVFDGLGLTGAFWRLQ